MLQAQNGLSAAYTQAAGLAPTGILTGTGLGNLTVTPGVYFFASSAQLTGQLTLNDEGNPDAVFVFQIGSTLTTASSSSVVTINDPTPSTAGMSVFWQVTSSATLGTGTEFEGNILALTSITDNGDSTVDGRLLAMNGAVSLDDTTVNILPAELASSGRPDTGARFRSSVRSWRFFWSLEVGSPCRRPGWNNLSLGSCGARRPASPARGWEEHPIAMVWPGAYLAVSSQKQNERTSIMTENKSVVAIFKSHTGAEAAVKELQQEGFDMKKLSIVGRDYHTDENVVGYYNTGDRMKYWGKLGAFWGGFWGLLFGSALFVIPGVGPLLMAGPIVGWIVGASKARWWWAV